MRCEHVGVLGEALAQQRVARLRREVGVRRARARRVEVLVEGDLGLHVVVLHVDGEQPERRHVARVGRHQHGRDAEDVHQPAQQQRPGAAERGEGEVADVEPALDGDLAQGVGLVPRGDLEHADGRGLRAQPELGGQPVDARARGVDVERDLAAEQVRRDPAEHDVGVGDRDVGAAAGVAERTGVGARRLRPDLERALGREPGDRAAAGADGHDVDHRDLARERADRALGGQRRLAVDDHRDVGRRTAAVAGQHPVEAGDLRDQCRAERAGGRSAEHGGDRLVHHLVGAEHAAVGLHHVERARSRARADVRREPGADVRDVRREPGLDRRVDEGGHRPLVLAVLPQHLAADADHRVGVLLGQDLPHPLLVPRVGVGVQEADAEGVDAAVAEPARDLARAVLVEGPHLGAGEVEPAADRADQVARHDPGRLDPEVGVAVAVGHRLARDLEHRVVPLGGDEPEPVDLALEQLVGGDGGAVADRADGATVERAVQAPSSSSTLSMPARNPSAGLAGRRRRLGGDQLAGVLVEGDHVGERATGVDADPDPARRLHGPIQAGPEAAALRRRAAARCRRRPPPGRSAAGSRPSPGR